MRPVMFLKTSNSMCLPGCKFICSHLFLCVCVCCFVCVWVLFICLLVGRFTDAWLFFFVRPVVDLISGSQHDSCRLDFSAHNEVSDLKIKATYMLDAGVLPCTAQTQYF